MAITLGPNPLAVWLDLCENVVQPAFDALKLVDDFGTPVTSYLRKWGITTGLSYPACIIGPFGLEGLSGDEDFEDWNIEYPILLAIGRPVNQDFTLRNDEHYWRQQVLDTFIYLPRTFEDEDGGAYVSYTGIEPASVPDQQKIDTNANLDWHAFVLKFTSARNRQRS